MYIRYILYLLVYTCVLLPLRWAYGAHNMPISTFPCGLRTEAAGGHTIIAWIHGRRSLYDFV